MTIIFQRYLEGQTLFGIFGGLGERYIAFHFHTYRLEVVWA